MKKAEIFKDKTNRKLALFLFISGAFYIYLAAQIPYTHDDWDWGLSNGWEQLVTANINSRYSGNFLEVLMTRSSVFKSLFMGIVFCALPFLAAVFTSRRREQILPLAIIANILILLMPSVIWQQTYGWVAGFANFATSALWVVVFFVLSKGLFQKNAPLPEGKLKAAAVLLFCVSMQLFAENITVFMLGVSLVFWLGAIFKWRKISEYYTAMLIGCLIGTIIMFSSSMYGTLMATGQAVDGYRELTFDKNDGASVIIKGFLVRFFSGFFPGIYGYYDGIYCLIIGFVLLLLLLKAEITMLMKALLAGFVGLSTVCLGAVYYLPLPFLASVRETVAVNGLFFLSVLASVMILFWQDKLLLLKLSGIWLAAPLVMVPLVVINTVGERSFLMPLIFLVMFCCALLAEINWSKAGLGGVILAVLMLYWGVVYTQIGMVNRERLALIDEAIADNAQTLVLPPYSHEEYLWQADPKSDYRKKYFKLFYGLNEDVEIIIEKGGV